MRQRESGPIVSPFVGDAEMQERLEAFVMALGERIDTLQDLELARDYKQREAQAVRVGREALPLGYPALAETCAEVEAACLRLRAAGVPVRKDAVAAVHETLVELTDVARRVRLGHRGGVFV
jgi:HPt (histidine-containing phosphotransfer) domain-containing protein